jgi:hypothetical protein
VSRDPRWGDSGEGWKGPDVIRPGDHAVERGDPAADVDEVTVADAGPPGSERRDRNPGNLGNLRNFGGPVFTASDARHKSLMVGT